MSPGTRSRLGVNPTAEDWRPPPGFASINSPTTRSVVGMGTAVGGVGNAMWSRTMQGTELGGNIDKAAKRESQTGSLMQNDTTNRLKSINESMDLDADLKDIDDLLNFSSLFPGGAAEDSGVDEMGNADTRNNSSSNLSMGIGSFADILEPHARNSGEW